VSNKTNAVTKDVKRPGLNAFANAVVAGGVVGVVVGVVVVVVVVVVEVVVLVVVVVDPSGGLVVVVVMGPVVVGVVDPSGGLVVVVVMGPVVVGVVVVVEVVVGVVVVVVVVVVISDVGMHWGKSSSSGLREDSCLTLKCNASRKASPPFGWNTTSTLYCECPVRSNVTFIQLPPTLASAAVNTSRTVASLFSAVLGISTRMSPSPSMYPRIVTEESRTLGIVECWILQILSVQGDQYPVAPVVGFSSSVSAGQPYTQKSL